jgi:hypothetical protein
MRGKAIVERTGRVGAYLLLGALGTLALALALLAVTNPLQERLYHAVYLSSGPTAATRTAQVVQFGLVAVIASTGTVLVATSVSQQVRDFSEILRGLVGLCVLVALYVAGTIGTVFPHPEAILGLGSLLLGIPLWLWGRGDLRSGGVLALAGAIPVVLLLFAALGFGLGWGWGYVLVAEEVPTAEVVGTDRANFDDLPAVRDDLFSDEHCDGDESGNRTCILELRGTEHEARAIRFLADHGVRCPYVKGDANRTGASRSVPTYHEGRAYRVTCVPLGD